MDKPKKQRIWHKVLLQIFDRRLYGRSFFVNSVPFLVVIFALQIMIYFLLNSPMLYIHVPLFVTLLIVSGFGSKNMSPRAHKREIHSMGPIRVFLFTLISIMASVAPFIVSQPSDPWLATAQYPVLYGLSTLALTMAVVEITLYGERISLRMSLELTDDFFKNQKEIWAEILADFPNSDNIVNCLDGVSAVTASFDHGSFGLALLLSFAVMEQILDEVAEGVISREPKKGWIFRHKKNFRKSFVDQIENLGFHPDLRKIQEDEKIPLKELYLVRNDFVHRSILPTFQQTFGVMATLKSFVEDMPGILQDLE